MQSAIKTNFEKWLIANASSDANGYYLSIGTIKAYLYFEGQQVKDMDYFIEVKIQPDARKRIAASTKQNTGRFVFYISGINILNIDKIADTIAGKIDEKTISDGIETDVLSSRYRAIKLDGSRHYQSICEVEFSRWEC